MNWDKIVKLGEELFEYMIHNFEIMFDGDLKIKHFDIECGIYGLESEKDEIKENYCDDIQKELIHWIKQEKEENELFQTKNWKPFRQPDQLFDGFLGYKNPFQYKNFVFQLSLNKFCELFEICEYCKDKRNCMFHFGLHYYGWIDDKCDKLQPFNIYFPYLWDECGWKKSYE